MRHGYETLDYHGRREHEHPGWITETLADGRHRQTIVGYRDWYSTGTHADDEDAATALRRRQLELERLRG